MLQRGISGVVGAEAWKGFVLGEDDRSGIAPAFDHAAQECGNGTRPFPSTAFSALP